MANKSAKDIAFEKERNKLKQQIRLKEREIHKKDFEIYKLQQEKQELQSKIDSQNEWIERLLEYTEMSKEDLEEMLSVNKSASKLNHMIGVISNGLGFRKERWYNVNDVYRNEH